MSTYNVNEAKLGNPLSISSGGTTFNSYSVGDTIYASAPNVLTKLPIGATGQVYTSTGSAPQWQTLATGATGATGNTGGTGGTGSTITQNAFYGILRGNQTINGGFDIVFATPVQTNTGGFTYQIDTPVPNSRAYVTIGITGVYLVSFGFFSTTTGEFLLAGLSINNAAPANAYRTGPGRGDRHIFASADTIIPLNANDQLSVKIVFDADLPVVTISDPVLVGSLSAYLNIVRLV